jgi:hypothetical protein
VLPSVLLIFVLGRHGGGSGGGVVSNRRSCW